MIKIIDEISKAGNIINEDLIWHNENCVVIFDVATSLNKNSKFSSEWFVKEFAKLFEKNIINSKDLITSVNKSISELYSTYLNKGGVDKIEFFPSASAIFVYEKKDVIEILNIGDCTALVFKKNKIKRIYCNEVQKNDNKVIKKTLKIRKETGKDISEILKDDQVKEKLISNRKLMNKKKNGYQILAFNISKIKAKQIKRFKKSKIKKMVLFSDGFDFKQQLFYSGNLDLESIYKDLRKDENEDIKLNAYPRFKISDDASAIIFKFE